MLVSVLRYTKPSYPKYFNVSPEVYSTLRIVLDVGSTILAIFLALINIWIFREDLKTVVKGRIVSSVPHYFPILGDRIIKSKTL